MIQNNRKPRTAIGTRNGLKIYTSLKKKPIKKVSELQKVKNASWQLTTTLKWIKVGKICLWCGKHRERNEIDGHHIIKRRYNIHTPENCYPCDRECHEFIERKNINLTKYPNLVAWGNRNV